MFDPFDHTRVCPEHGVQACFTCHQVQGECDMGGCTEPATRRAEIRLGGRVVEVRPICDRAVCEMILVQTGRATITLREAFR